MALGLGLGLFVAGQASATCKLLHADVPVTMIGRTAMVPATINGRSVRLQLDTGAFASLLDEDVARASGLHLHPSAMGVEGEGGRVSAQMTWVREFALAGVKAAPNRPLLVIPFTHGGAAAGLLGQDILSAYDVELDLANGLIRLMEIRDCGDNLAYWSDGSDLSVLPIASLSGGEAHIVATVQVNGQPVRAMFDTGASHSTIGAAAAARAGVRPADSGVMAFDTMGGVGPHLRESWIGAFAEVQIGAETIKNTQLVITSNRRPGDVDMLLGADFFLSHRVLVSRSKNRIFFTYSGGPVFRTDGPPPQVIGAALPGQAPVGGQESAAAATDVNAPRDAAAFERRGAAKLTRRDYQGAIADFDKAAGLAPAQASVYYHRALARRALEDAGALADADKALSLQPDYPDARLLRARLYAAKGESQRSAADLGEAVRLAHGEPRAQIAAALAYGRIGEHGKGVEVLDQLVASRPGDLVETEALEARCWLRTQAGRELDWALADCETVIRRRGRNSDALAQRALVRLRRGEAALALADFDAALKLQPKLAPALYGRGLAKQRLGQSATADADLQAAKALDPEIGESFGVD